MRRCDALRFLYLAIVLMTLVVGAIWRQRTSRTLAINEGVRFSDAD